MGNFDLFRFTPDMLSGPRKPGISAYMRIKNEEQFVRLAIESHMPFYDEIIACYNDCSDNTEAILLDIAQHHPKVKVFHYLPKVYPPGSSAYAEAADDDVCSLANYYNFALSKCSYCFAAKLDADHLAIPCKFELLTNAVRNAVAAGVTDTIFNQSGINLMLDVNGNIGVAEKTPFVGGGDYFYHPVTTKLTYKNNKLCEYLNKQRSEGWKNEYGGITSFHLKLLKPGYGLANHSHEIKQDYIRYYWHDAKVVSFAEFCSPACRKRLIKQSNGHDRRRIFFLQTKIARKLKSALTGKNVRLSQLRLINLPEYLDGIDFQRDALAKLRKLV